MSHYKIIIENRDYSLWMIYETFLNTEFEGGRHSDRIAKINR